MGRPVEGGGVAEPGAGIDGLIGDATGSAGGPDSIG
jgi:hypothetical protein